MTDLIDRMPGVSLPVGEVTERLAHMWEAGPGGSPSEFRASQMNVVLHFGLEVTPEAARERFDVLIRFAQRYPSRIIVLCPSPKTEKGAMQARLFSQCYIGDSQREMCCCEALLLAYQSEDCGYLANQVSVWLEGDLPTYHWFSEVPPARIEKYFDNLLVGVRRCIYDSSIELSDLSGLAWPQADRVSDLAKARLLPVRQAIGQFMSGFAMRDLCEGLKTVEVRHGPGLKGEGTWLMAWVQGCLADCKECAEGPATRACFTTEALPAGDEGAVLTMEWSYDDGRFFKWCKLKDGSLGEIHAKFGKHEERIPLRVKPLAPEAALAEALFFL